MKQPNTWTCGAVAAAMAAGTTLEAFYEHAGHDGAEMPWPDSLHPEKRRGFSFKEMAKFLLDHDIFAGSGMVINELIPGKPFEVWMEIDPKKYKMLIGVESERFEGVGHWIYWDTVQVHDPNPDSEDGRPLTSYKIEDIWLLQDA